MKFSLNKFLTTLYLSFLLVVFTHSAQANIHLMTFKVRAGTWQQQWQAFAQVSAKNTLNIKFTKKIKLEKSLVQQGDIVTKGQRLLQFNAMLVEQELATYKTALMQLNLAKKQAVYLASQQKLIPQATIFNAKLTVIAARKNKLKAWQQLNSQLAIFNRKIKQKDLNQQLNSSPFNTDKLHQLAKNYSQLKAPFAGRIVTLAKADGYWFHTDENIITLEKIDRLYVTVWVSPSQQKNWMNGQTELILNPNKVKQKFVLLTPLHQANTSTNLDPITGLVSLLFTVNNPHYQLHSNQWLLARHLATKQKVFWLPTRAVVSRHNASWCMIKQNSGKFIARKVTIGENHAGKVPVITGLKINDIVVTQGAYELLYADIDQLIKFVD